MAESIAFYTQVLVFESNGDMGWIAFLGSPSVPTTQIQLITSDATAPVVPNISVEVEDVDAVYHAAATAGARIVHPLTNEPWGVRRFFVEDPNGVVINVMMHLPNET
jgi:uncharacterized glyoxalase superfamily protein PhnB